MYMSRLLHVQSCESAGTELGLARHDMMLRLKRQQENRNTLGLPACPQPTLHRLILSIVAAPLPSFEFDPHL